MERYDQFGLLLEGSLDYIQKSYERFKTIPIDMDLSNEKPAPLRKKRQTIVNPAELSAPGTFFCKEIRHIRLEPCDKQGWWFDRKDRPQSLPIKVSPRNVWTVSDIVRNIVLRSGSSNNYMRLIEHIVALMCGVDVDNLMIKVDSGDPPLFKNGSLDLIEALENAGRKELDQPLRYFTVKETVSYSRRKGEFLIISPCDPDNPALEIDCAIDFSSAIGQQRIKFPLNSELFRKGSVARTNTSALAIFLSKTIGLLIANVRNLGYTRENVLIAGKNKYRNEPRLVHNGKSLEAVWHRAVLDLLAAVALVEEGRFLGKITSFKAGHYQDVEMFKLIYANDLLEEVKIS